MASQPRSLGLSSTGRLNGNSHRGRRGFPHLSLPPCPMACSAVQPDSISTIRERRREPNGSLRVIHSARLAQCSPCPLRAHCQEAGATKPRMVSALLWPISSLSAAAPPTPPGPLPVIWGDWPRRALRRQWIQLLRSQTVEIAEQTMSPERQTRAQRAHWRLSWSERLTRNARPPSAPLLTITLHGLPTSFAHFFGIAVVTGACDFACWLLGRISLLLFFIRMHRCGCLFPTFPALAIARFAFILFLLVCSSSRWNG